MSDKAKLKVVIRPGGGNRHGLEEDERLPRGVELHGDTLKIAPDASPVEIVFKLKGSSDHLTYTHDPIWVQSGSECPTGPGLAGFRLTERKDKTITVEPPNDPGPFKYALHFVDRDGRPDTYDPIIMNRA